MKWSTVLKWVVGTTVLLGAGVGRLAQVGMVTIPGTAVHPGLESQLRDRGTVAIAGSVPFGLRRGDVSLVEYRQFGPLAAALDGRDPAALSRALRAARVDGLLVRTDRAQGQPGSVLRSLSEFRAIPDVCATWMDHDAALYEARDRPLVTSEDGPKLIEAVRLMVEGAAAPPERLFPEPLRGARPAEVMVVVRDGAAPILWRAVRGSSVARALVDATYAVIDRWNTRQQQAYGPIREAIRRMPLTVAVFYDKGTLDTREAAWIDRAVDASVFAVGYERLGRWEYVLPPSSGGPARKASTALADLVREHDVPPPGFQRTDLTLYRFRALQMIEQTPGGTVQIFNP